GIGGIVTTPIGTDAGAYSLIIQPNGKLVTAGYSSNGIDSDFTLVRYNADGSLDASFGTGGIVTTDFEFLDDVAFALAIQPDRNLVAVGYCSLGPDTSGHLRSKFALARYNTDGSLDTSFGTGGKVTTLLQHSDFALSIAIQPDGKLVVAGESNTENHNYF